MAQDIACGLGGGGRSWAILGEKELFNQRKETYFLALRHVGFSWPQFPFCAGGLGGGQGHCFRLQEYYRQGVEMVDTVPGAQCTSPYGWCLLMAACLLAFF